MVKLELVLDPPEPEIYILSGKQLVVATVKPGHGPVYQAHGIYWVRRGTHTGSLSLSELLEMANDRGLMDWEHQPVRNATMEDIDLEKVKAYLARRSENSRHTSRFKDIERVLIGMEWLLKQAMVVSCRQMRAFYSLALILKIVSPQLTVIDRAVHAVPGTVLSRLDGIEAHLIGRDTEIGSCFIGVGVILTADSLDPEFGPHLPKERRFIPA